MGFVNYMEAERSNGQDDLCIDQPSLEQILNAISSMDGAGSTYVMLHPGDPEDNVYLPSAAATTADSSSITGTATAASNCG